jgi:hypothetical protein
VRAFLAGHRRRTANVRGSGPSSETSAASLWERYRLGGPVRYPPLLPRVQPMLETQPPQARPVDFLALSLP